MYVPITDGPHGRNGDANVLSTRHGQTHSNFLIFGNIGRYITVQPLQIATVSGYVTINTGRQRDNRTYAPIANRVHDRSRRAIALIHVYVYRTSSKVH